MVVLAATGAPNELDAAVRRFGRLDREVALEVPDEAARREILTVKTRHMALEDDVDLDDVARDCHGFVGADLAQLCTEAALLCVRGALRDAESNAPFTEGMLDDERQEASWAALAEQLDLDPDHLKVSKAHFTKAAKTCNPSSLRESVVEVPDVSWADVGGLENVKTEPKETAESPVQVAGESRNSECCLLRRACCFMALPVVARRSLPRLLPMNAVRTSSVSRVPSC